MTGGNLYGVASADVRRALRAAAEAGPYFAVGVPDGERAWVPFALLVSDGELLRGRVEVTRAVLAGRTGSEVELRACASINFLGMVSRLVAPALATAAVAGVVPVFTPGEILWSPVEGGPIPVAVADPRGSTVRGADAAGRVLYRDVVATTVAPLVDAYAATFHVSTKVLWGNVSSALAGAAGMLGRSDIPQGIGVVDIVEAALRLGRLLDSGHYERPESLRPRAFFVRHNCCLFYRIPAGGMCGDCVLVPHADREGRWRQQLGG